MPDLANELDATIVLITGSNKGVGYATAQALLLSKVKYTIILTSRSRDRAIEASEEVQKEAREGGNGDSCTVPAQLDIEDDDSIKALHDKVQREYGRVDVLINNAGSNYDSDVRKGVMTTREAFTKSLNLNITSSHMMTEAFCDLLLQSSSPRLIFLSTGISSLGDHSDAKIPINAAPKAGWPKESGWSYPTYRSSKTGGNMMALEWATTLRNDGVKTHLIDPGLLATDLGNNGRDVLRQHGALEPIVGGRFVASVVEGERDADVEKIVTQGGVVPW